MHRRTVVAAAATAVVGALAFGTTSVAAAGHHTFVVRPGHSIQEAINDAMPGDTVLVMPGMYHQSLQITKDDITLRGADREDSKAVIMPPATPPANLCTNANGGATSGVCVLGRIDAQGNVVRPVRGDTIEGLTFRGFPANGVFGYGTSGLRVSHVSAFNDGDYGIARFVSTGTTFSHNRTAGNAEAGLYVGDSPDARTVVIGNSTWNNGFGVFVRHSHGVVVSGNSSWSNCVGVLVLDDGQPGGAGDVQVVDNNVSGNNHSCPAGDGPPTSGGGIVLVGAVRTLVAGNHVDGNNSGGTVVSGGIVVLSAKPLDGGSNPIDDTITGNVAYGNAPADVIWDGTGHGNRFIDNRCGTSTPSRICR